ncbi:hypothetical protein NLU13_0485 [Sarocladium strictum]|uniref:SMODS and SLOG-associating 2TM effector domain-containing protein n=1 Tax=Sarocladium strictum TaxID=5046 RepID=A0AA39GP53_SARSR|nr:hypothetical protein NLU13_0485 [Sarocladium strictum]
MSSPDIKAKGKPMLPALSLLRNAQSAQASKDIEKRGSAVEEFEPPPSPRHRFLSGSEWTTFGHGVGGIKGGEGQDPVRPHGGGWPPRGMPRGLYKDVVVQKTKCFYLFHVSSIFRWTLLILQILIGATLTALGPSSVDNSLAITILGAANTVVAGLLALLHNSGLPDRFRYDMQEFERVEDHIRGILEGRLAPADEELDQLLAECFGMFSQAKETVSANMPPSYNSHKSSEPTKRQSGTGPLSSASSQDMSGHAPNGEKSFMT